MNPAPPNTQRYDATVVGGGIAGLVAAVTVRESGGSSCLLERRSCLGGRSRSTTSPYIANWGPHAIYADGRLWRWLEDRDLLGEVVEPAIEAGVVFRRDGRHSAVPVDCYEGISALQALDPPPSNAAFAEWASAQLDDRTARGLASLAGVFSFHHSPGALSAGFALERLSRAMVLPPVARYVVGGWAKMIDAVENYARQIGVDIRFGAHVTEVRQVRRPAS